MVLCIISDELNMTVIYWGTIVPSPMRYDEFHCFHPAVFFCFCFIEYEVGIVVQVWGAKLIRCGMINIVSRSRVSRTRIGLSIGFCLYFLR